MEPILVAVAFPGAQHAPPHAWLGWDGWLLRLAEHIPSSLPQQGWGLQERRWLPVTTPSLSTCMQEFPRLE